MNPAVAQAPKQLPSDADLAAVLQDDAELLALYCESNDRAAVETLIHRYAPLVASICRGLIADRQAAEDAFQATFLILLRKAGAIRRRRSVAAWLHGVAYRTACRQRQTLRKIVPRGQSESPELKIAMEPSIEDDPLSRLARQLDLEALMIEVESLPARIREPIVEHYLHGRTMQNVAERMELSLAAVEGRIRRGRSILRNRLAQKGMGLSVALAAAAWCRTQAVAAESTLWTQRLLSGVDLSSPLPPRTLDSDRLSDLIGGELNMRRIFWIRTAATVGAAAVITSAGYLASIPILGSLPADEGQQPAVLTIDTDAASQPAAALFQYGLAAQPDFTTQDVQPPSTPDTSSADAATGEATAMTTVPPSGTIPLTRGGGEYGGMFGAMPPGPQRWRTPEGPEPAWLDYGGRRSIENDEKYRDFREKLLAPISLEYNGQQLQTALTDISERLLTPIVIDHVALAEGIATLNEPVSLMVKDVPLETALDLMLDPLQLTYTWKDSVIMVTTKDQVSQYGTLRYYELSFVMPNDAATYELISLIESTVPGKWDESEMTITSFGSLLVVRAPEKTHQAIEAVLARIAQMPRENFQRQWSQPPTAMGGMGGGGGGGGMF